ncbi:MAG: hypothetical protein EA378_10610 [Phycisphaerales bacterium]|nr:MAG: hypothetical protein EA378_10610 [Phycisphaerales bacterium]
MLALVLLAGVAGAAVFGVPTPIAPVEPLPERFEPTALPTPPRAEAPRRVDIADLAFPLSMTHNAPVPPEPETGDTSEVSGEAPEAPPAPPEREGVRFLGSARGTGGAVWAIVVIDGSQRLLQVGRSVGGVELVSVEDDAIVVRSNGRERRVTRAERSSSSSVSVASASPAPMPRVPAGSNAATGRVGRGATMSSTENMDAATQARLIREQRAQQAADIARERARLEAQQRGQD